MMRPVWIGKTSLQLCSEAKVEGEYVTLLGETFYKIHHFDALEPFFITVVSSSDHWMFISSRGGLTAGRVSAEKALFPYSTVDKLIDNRESTGNKAILLVRRGNRTHLWEPFSERSPGFYCLERSLYKNIEGTALVFEETNLDLGLMYRYAWRTSDRYGFVKTTWLANTLDAKCQVELVDGLQNILPANVTSASQQTFSCLLDAYKRSELEPGAGLGIFTLSSILTDLAEPSESLLATTVFQLGLEGTGYLLSSQQLDRFRAGLGVTHETDVRGQRGAYFVHAALDLAAGPGGQRTWHLAAEVEQDHSAVVSLIGRLKSDRAAFCQDLEEDLAANTSNLWRITARADGLQVSRDRMGTSHHFANVMFNIMRGGILADPSWIDKADLLDFISSRNRSLRQSQADFFDGLPDRIQVSALQEQAQSTGCEDLLRLCQAYLPLTFSRRHGDPSRPWNTFAIQLNNADGTPRFDYEGNWRDIFQNWEALAWSYPEYVENMISIFLGATTADGYNPYRVTRQGIDWEVPQPNHPWANIGYWSDHQIIYLQKLMEVSAKTHPGRLESWLDRPMFSYAHVPYRIKPYDDLLADPYHSIEFNWELEREIKTRVEKTGADGTLVQNKAGKIVHASLAEKLLGLLLAKLANFVPEGGIWMNTQRPEWNDANNALVGKGLSVVTLCYLRRYIVFAGELLAKSTLETLSIHQEVVDYYRCVYEILKRFRSGLSGSFEDERRREIVDALGRAGSEYRQNYYKNGFSDQLVGVEAGDLADFLELANEYVEHSLRANRRADALYHAYNILHMDGDRAYVSALYEMLEGQVAILSSGFLSAQESLALLQALRQSALFREDQHSYLLYPDRNLAGFLAKNCIPPESARSLGLISALAADGDASLVMQDTHGDYHFSGRIRNAADVARILEALKRKPRYTDLVNAESAAILTLFEDTFRHAEFTGRSGTFFAYEGLGSIYWHMVSKLLLAVQETALRARGEESGASLFAALTAVYFDIRQGLGFKKTPRTYGAFPTDPYSHTPKGQGAKQPGMTGMVKEEIIARMAEVGLFIEDGRLVFDRALLDPDELLNEPCAFDYLDTQGQKRRIDLATGCLAFTFCQTPVVVRVAEEAHVDAPSIQVVFTGGASTMISGRGLDRDLSRHIFQRDGVIDHLHVTLK